MTNIFLLCVIAISLAGCITTSDTVESVQKRYEQVKINDGISDKEALIWAQNELLKNPLNTSYQLFKPQLDTDLKMPDSYKYIFVRFMPNENQTALAGKVFLVVINPYLKRIEFADEFQPPGGDPLYKYNELLKQIEHR